MFINNAVRSATSRQDISRVSRITIYSRLLGSKIRFRYSFDDQFVRNVSTEREAYRIISSQTFRPAVHCWTATLGLAICSCPRVSLLPPCATPSRCAPCRPRWHLSRSWAPLRWVTSLSKAQRHSPVLQLTSTKLDKRNIRHKKV